MHIPDDIEHTGDNINLQPTTLQVGSWAIVTDDTGIVADSDAMLLEHESGRQYELHPNGEIVEADADV